MHVFVTGSTGYVGSAIVRALVGAGHRVSGLVRSAERERALVALGGAPVRGDYKDLSTFLDAAQKCDAFVHAAIEYSADGIAKGGSNVLAVIEAAARTGKPRSALYTSGVWVLGQTHGPADESAPTDHPAAAVTWRPAQEQAVLRAGGDACATAVIRPGIVYGRKGGFVAQWFTSAQQDGVVTYVGDGKNRWPFVHVDDLARLYLLVLERRASGIFHGVDGHSTAVADAARAASQAAGRAGAVKSHPVERARATMGPVADAVAMDQDVVTTRSTELGWKPERASFLEGVRAAYKEFTA